MRIRRSVTQTTAAHKGRIARVRGSIGEHKAPKAPRMPKQPKRP
jgi:hypothetical protein